MNVFFDWRWWIIKKYDDIGNKARNSMEKQNDRKPIYNKEN